MMIVIDIGNTKTDLGMVQNGVVKRTWKLATNKRLLGDEYIAQYNSFLTDAGLRFETSPICLASVVPHISEQLRLKTKHRQDVHLVHFESPVDFSIALPKPQSLGADLIAAAQGAIIKYPPPLIMIDAGTATTITAINSKREFVGGAISPGLGISSQALFHSASALASIELHLPETAIGNHTNEAVLSGVCLGHAGMIEKLVERFESELKETCTVVATGGAMERLMPALPSRYILHPSLTLEGLVSIFQKTLRHS